MILNWKSITVTIFVISIGILVMFFIITKLSNQHNRLEKIDVNKSYNIEVIEANNERGIYVLNNNYYLNSATLVIGNHYGYAVDEAIWRFKNAKYTPTISDISAPFRIKKEVNNDTLILKKGDKTILLLLTNE